MGAASKLLIVPQQVVIFLHQRSAASGVGDNGVVVAAQEYLDIFARQLPRIFAEPGMGIQRAATALPCRDVHLNAVFNEHLHRGAVQMRKSNVIDASGQKSYFAPPLTHCRKSFSNFPKKEFGINLW